MLAEPGYSKGGGDGDGGGDEGLVVGVCSQSEAAGSSHRDLGREPREALVGAAVASHEHRG